MRNSIGVEVLIATVSNIKPWGWFATALALRTNNLHAMFQSQPYDVPISPILPCNMGYIAR